MENKLPLHTEFNAEVLKLAVKSRLPIGTWWFFEHYRKGELIGKWDQKNVTHKAGINYLLNAGFHGATVINPWYMIVFEDDYTPLEDDTYAVPGYTECTAYDEATRPEFVEAEATNKIITNVVSKAVFTFNATKTIYGAGLVGGGSAAATKGDAAGGGTLFAASKFGTAKPVYDDDVFMGYASIVILGV
jgi:hypothetical protein